MISIYDEYIPPAKHIRRAKMGLPVTREALANPLYIYIPFARQGLVDKQLAVADDINIDMELLPPERLHMTLLWAQNCSEAALAAIISGLAMPIRFGIEIASLAVLKDALVWAVVGDPALMRLQSDLYRRALNEGIELSEYSPPSAWVPHISIAYDLISKPETLPQIEPFRLQVDRFIVGRHDYEKVYTVHLARAMGDRVLVEQGEVLRHGEHEGQEGREGQAGGSQPGFTHGGAKEKTEKVSKAKEVLGRLTPLTDKEPWRASWMAPDGELLAYGHDHQETALKIMEEIDPKIAAADETGLVATDSVISDLGFIRISKFQDQLGFSIPMKITGAQKKSIAHMMDMVKAKFGGRVDMYVDRFGDPESPDLFSPIPAHEVANIFGLSDDFYDLGNFTIKTRGYGTEVTKSELMALMRGETIIHGALRQVLTIRDGPFAVRRHSRKRCMHCKKHPEVAVHWADGRGMAWFCLKDFESWMGEDDREVVGVWFVKDGEVPEDVRDIGSKDKVRKLGQKLSTKEILKRLKSLRESGAPGSGFYEHAGRLGEVDGSQPRGGASPQEVGMKQAKPSFKGKEKMFGKEYYVAFANLDNFPEEGDFAELWDSVVANGEWPSGAGERMRGLLQDSIRVEADSDNTNVKEERAIEEKLEELWNRARLYLDLSIPPKELMGLNNIEIEELMRELVKEMNEKEITNDIKEEESDYLDGPDYNYIFGRNEFDEIVSAMMGQNDMGYGSWIAEWIGEEFEGSEDARMVAIEESYDNPYVAVQWLASKYHGNGYGTQMMAEAFKYAAGKDAGLFLNADLGAIDFYKELEPIVQNDSVFVWTPSKVMELAKRSTREGFTGKSLTTRESLSDVKIGGEEIEDYEDLEPLGGAFVSPLDARKAFPRSWRKKIEEEQGLGFISDEDMAVLGERDVLSKLPEGSFGMFSTARDELMRGVRKSLEGLVLDVMGWVRRQEEEQKINGEEHGQETSEEQEPEKPQEPEEKEPVERHLKHVGQEGRPGAAGGSKPGFTHGPSGGGAQNAGEGVDYDRILETKGMEAALNSTRPDLAESAQAIYDSWQVDEEGLDPEFGGGGICDRIAAEMGGELVNKIGGIGILDGGQPGDAHAYVIVYNNKEAWGVDIPAGIYEEGGGYNWKKIPGVEIKPEQVEVFPINHSDLEFAEGLDEDVYFAERVSPWAALIIPSFHADPDFIKASMVPRG